ncbi:TcfC E-set like domain-containing protein [Pseudomonas kitaguniensis]|uniref:TcfC E-set like domain-containing protein n=1 Tax=Pseudomonas kitaguniensis TaxID=2607908 RepID=UPI003CFCA67C
MKKEFLFIVKQFACSVFFFFMLHQKSIAAEKVPEGFTSLDQAQQVLLEVSVPGQKIGFFLADVDAETVTFENPQALIDVMPLSANLSAVEQQRILAALSAPHKRNSQLACEGSTQINGCGYITTDSVGYIYDEANQSISIFLSQKWLDLKSLHKQPLYFQSSADLKSAFIHRQTVNYAANNDYKNISISGVGALGVGERGYIGTAWRYLGTESSEQNFSQAYFDQFYYRYDIGNQYYFQAGRMDQRNLSSNLGGAFGFSILPIGTMDGFRIGSTEAYVNQAAKSQGTPVNLILTVPSRVDVYRGNQLLGTSYVQGGLQNINTAEFPDGSYLLTLKIFENGQLTRTETQPFSKSVAGTGNAGDFQWFAQTGTAEDQTQQNSGSGQIKKSPTTLIGARLNTGFNTATTLGAEEVRNVRYAETKFEWALPTQFGDLNTTANFFYGSDGSRGDAQQIYWNDGFSASIYRYNVSSANCDSNSYLSCYQSINATVGANLLGWSTTLGYTSSKAQNRPSRVINLKESDVQTERPFETYTNEYGSPLKTFSNRSIQLNFSRSFVRKNWIYNPSISVYQSQNGQRRDNGMTLSLTLSRRTQAAGNGRSDFQSAQATFRQAKEQPGRENYQLSHVSSWDDSGYREVGATVTTDNESQRGLNINGRADTAVGRFSGTISHNQGIYRTQTDFSGQYSSSFAVAPNLFVWGSDNGGSDPLGGVVFETQAQGGSDAERQPVADIQMPGSTKTTVHTGERTFVPIEGFQSVKSHVEDSSTRTGDGVSNLKQGSSDQVWFMQPGKLGVKKLIANIQYTYLGQLLLNGKNLLGGGMILNATVPDINEDGTFIAEFNGQPNELYVFKEQVLYQCPVKVLKTVNGLRQVGAIECTVIVEKDLPIDLKSSHRVVKILKALSPIVKA